VAKKGTYLVNASMDAGPLGPLTAEQSVDVR